MRLLPPLQRLWQMLEDLLILQSENRNVLIIGDRFRSVCIFVGGEIMDRSIQFDNQCRIRAEEIYDEPTDWHLSSEFQSVEFPIPDNIPQNYFGWR